jgi:hypothetical protein
LKAFRTLSGCVFSVPVDAGRMGYRSAVPGTAAGRANDANDFPILLFENINEHASMPATTYNDDRFCVITH